MFRAPRAWSGTVWTELMSGGCRGVGVLSGGVLSGGGDEQRCRGLRGGGATGGAVWWCGGWGSWMVRAQPLRGACVQHGTERAERCGRSEGGEA